VSEPILLADTNDWWNEFMLKSDQYDKVGVFFDMSNLYFAARDLGIRVDYTKLLDFLTAGRRLHRAYAYVAVASEDSTAIPFLTWLRRNGFRVVTKSIKRFSDGTIKGDLDMELAVDLLTQAPYIDVAVIVSGDGDFTYLVDRAQRLGIRVEIASTPRNTAIELLEIADRFIDLEAYQQVFALGKPVHNGGDYRHDESGNGPFPKP
jgi:uncharacterized LabA/DUF88 family protein